MKDINKAYKIIENYFIHQQTLSEYNATPEQLNEASNALNKIKDSDISHSLYLIKNFISKNDPILISNLHQEIDTLKQVGDLTENIQSLNKDNINAYPHARNKLIEIDSNKDRAAEIPIPDSCIIMFDVNNELKTRQYSSDILSERQYDELNITSLSNIDIISVRYNDVIYNLGDWVEYKDNRYKLNDIKLVCKDNFNNTVANYAWDKFFSIDKTYIISGVFNDTYNTYNTYTIPISKLKLA
jgi:hypothetical protein